MEGKKIYLGCQISGSSYDDVMQYLDVTEKRLEKMGYEIFAPMKGKQELRTEKTLRSEGYNTPTSTNHAIFERDMWMVSQCDIFYLNLDHPDTVSIGGMMELAVASYLRKHTIVVMPKYSIHRHAFVLEAADVVFESYFDAMRYLRTLVAGPSEEEEKE